MSERMIVKGWRHDHFGALEVDGSHTEVRQSPDSPGLVVIATGAASSAPNGPLGQGPTVSTYWQMGEGEDPYLVIEIDRAVPSDPTPTEAEIVALGFKVYIDDALIHAENTP